MYLRQRPQIQELLHRKIQIGAVPHSAAQYARPGRRGIGRRSCPRKPRAYPISAPSAILRANPTALPPASATTTSIPAPAACPWCQQPCTHFGECSRLGIFVTPALLPESWGGPPGPRGSSRTRLSERSSL